ncbi:MAG: hypothetical protein GKS05_10720 [Nitrospirales bacterium]|nr:hypothetical protein [Nitrospirales bacterium]
MIIASVLGTLLLSFVSCVNPTLMVRPLHDEANLFIGTASSHTQEQMATVRYEHPVEWAETDLYAILSQLRIQEEGGLLDTARLQRAVFFPEEIPTLLPGLRDAFKLARPSDWIVFAFWVSSPRSETLEVTSGGFFLQDHMLHIILANHHERVLSEEEGILAIRRNPFHIVNGVKGLLQFASDDYVVNSQRNWVSGGFESSAAELILDYKAFLTSTHLPRTTVTERPTGSEHSKEDSALLPSSLIEVRELQEEVSKLKAELSRLKRQLGKEDEAQSP